jgi:ribosome-associated toxin RatA of RatAB toxin-antitoxin module
MRFPARFATRPSSARATLLAAFVLVACGERAIDWSAPENFLLREKSSKEDDRVKLDYLSLVDADCDAVYAALADVEHYPDFVPGVDTVQLLGQTPDSKTVQIAQRVIGRQSNAKVEWTFAPQAKRIAFRTLQSNLSRNDGTYELKPSPDGKRCGVHSTFFVKEAQGEGPPIGVLASGTREAFLSAARGVKKRAVGAAS